MSNSLWLHGLQHDRLPCLSPAPRACSHSCPLSRWCHPTISSSVIPFSSSLQSSPASGSFQMSQLFASFSSVQFSSVSQLCPTLCDSINHSTQSSLSITNSQSSPKLMSIESVMPFNHLIICHFLLLLPSIFPNIRLFSNVSALRIRWPKYWSFSFNISPSNEYSLEVFILMCPRDSQESSPTPQFKSINSLALSFLYSPTLTSIHDYWKYHSFD